VFESVTFQLCVASVNGGAIYIQQVIMSFHDCIFIANTAGFRGNDIYHDDESTVNGYYQAGIFEVCYVGGE
jgi:hypothetical protein